MMNLFLHLTLFTILSLFSPANLALAVNFAQVQQGSAKNSPSLVIANIKDASVVEGCGCYFHALTERKKRAEKFIFLADVNEDAWMNINGKDVKLRFINSSRDAAEPKIGQRSFSRYKSGDFIIRVDYVVTRVCRPSDEQCESTGYDARISIAQGASKRVIKARGDCGC